jgi:hypothetical protein
VASNQVGSNDGAFLSPAAPQFCDLVGANIPISLAPTLEANPNAGGAVKDEAQTSR